VLEIDRKAFRGCRIGSIFHGSRIVSALGFAEPILSLRAWLCLLGGFQPRLRLVIQGTADRKFLVRIVLAAYGSARVLAIKRRVEYFRV
jgi:hypothetical protein